MGAFDSVTKKISSILGITTAGQATAANSVPVVLPSTQDALNYASAWQDDGSESGYAKIVAARGSLVPVPVISGRYASTVQNSGAVSFQTGSITQNLDGTQNGVNLSHPGGLTATARISYTFDGRIFGLRWRRVGTEAGLAVAVDNVWYSPQTHGTVYYEQTRDRTATEAIWLWPDLLSDGAHTALVEIVGESTAKSVILHGFVAERLPNYVPIVRGADILTGTLTASLAAIPFNSNANKQWFGLRGMIYTNGDTVARIVTVQTGSSPLTFWAKSIAAGDSAICDLLQPTFIDSNWKHKADAAAVVTYALLEGVPQNGRS